jgi:K+-transporting ATPase ATPase C chain
MKESTHPLLSACRMLLWLTVLTGILYPLLTTALAQLTFPLQANGSLIALEGKAAVGSRLIGQHFTKPAYFWGRPSASDYNTMPSAASNLSYSSPILHQQVASRQQALLAAMPQAAQGRIPSELLFASASGLDPHISFDGAIWQLPRIAEMRKLTSDTQRQELLNLVSLHTRERFLGVGGSFCVNVLELNIALDKQYGHPQ